jgi:polysaccharide transporter, PST family
LDKNSKSQAAKNIAFTGAAQVWRFATGLVLTIITTRYLQPSDFGLLAMVSTATVFINVIKDFGIGQAIVQSPAITSGQINTLFWVSVFASTVLAGLLAGSAPLLALFYAEPRVLQLTLAFAALTLVGGTLSVPTALLNRDSRFNDLALIDAASSGVSLIVGVASVVIWRTYWSLWASAAGATGVAVMGYWYFSKYRPGLPHLDRQAGQLLRFGSHLSGFNIVNFFSRSADNILIGRFQGSDQLGLYDRAYKLLLFPLSQLTGPIGQVLVPLLSRIQNEPGKYRSTYADAVSIMMIVAQPGILLATMFAPQVFQILLGDQWIAAAPIFQWLGIAGLHQIMTSTLGWLFISQGRGSDFFKVGIYSSALTVLSFVIGLPWGAVGVAASYTVANYVAVVPLSWISSGRRGPVSCGNLVAIAMPHLVATCASAVFLWLAKMMFSEIGAFQMVLLGSLSYLAYLSVILLFPSKRELIDRTVKFAARGQSRSPAVTP